MLINASRTPNLGCSKPSIHMLFFSFVYTGDSEVFWHSVAPNHSKKFNKMSNTENENGKERIYSRRAAGRSLEECRTSMPARRSGHEYMGLPSLDFRFGFTHVYLSGEMSFLNSTSLLNSPLLLNESPGFTHTSLLLWYLFSSYSSPSFSPCTQFRSTLSETNNDPTAIPISHDSYK